MSTRVDRASLRHYCENGLPDRMPVICTGSGSIKHSKETMDVEIDSNDAYCVKCGRMVQFANPFLDNQ